MARTKTGKRLEAEATSQEYVLAKVRELQEHPDNPRRGSEEAIDESIDVNGWYGAVVVQRSTGRILAGNHRFRVAKKRGATTVPAILVDVDDETALRIMLADNRTADLGGYDQETLDALLGSLDSLEGTGWDAALESVIEEETKTAEPPASEDIPDDDYTPQFAVIVVLADEEAQQQVYMDLLESDLPEGAEVKVTAV